MTCPSIKYIEREKIFRQLEFDRTDNQIYEQCNMKPIGKNINGKIKWYKKNK